MKDSKTLEKLLQKCEQSGIKFWLSEGALKYKAPKGVMSDELKESLSSSKVDIIEYLQQDTITHNEKMRYEEFDLTVIQSAYLVGSNDLYEYGGIDCKVYCELETELLDYHKLNKALNDVIARHDMLRTIIYRKGKQKVLREVNYKEIERLELGELPEEKIKEKLLEIRKQLIKKEYKPESWPMFDLILVKTSEKDYLCFSIDMLIADFQSVRIFVQELEDCYYDKYVIEEAEITFRDVVCYHNRKSLENKNAYERAKEYWLGRIPSLPDGPELPVMKKSEVQSADIFAQYNYLVDRKTWEKFRSITKEQGITPSNALLALYTQAIGYWSRQKRFLINITTSNRPQIHKDINRVIGDFTAVDLLEADMTKAMAFNEYALMIQNQFLSDFENNAYTGVEVLREMKRKSGKDAIIPVVFTSTLREQEEEETVESKFRLHYKISQTPQVWIDCQISSQNDGILINWDVRKGIFPDKLISYAFDLYINLFTKLADEKSAWKEENNISLPDTMRVVRSKVNSSKQEFKDVLLYEGIIENIKLFPEKVAVVVDNASYTYKQLADCAYSIQQILLEEGIKKGDIAALNLRNGIYQIAGMIGIMWAGAAYLPLDYGQPSDRKQRMLEKANARFILSDLHENKFGKNYKIIYTEKIEEKRFSYDNFAPVEMNTDETAYVIFTSGSTGEPKGVMISHKAVMNTISDINDKFRVNSNDTVLVISNIAFDLSVYDIFGILNIGGKVVVPLTENIKNPPNWESLMQREEVTIWNSVPAQLQMFLIYVKSIPKTGYKLRLALLSGDWIPVTLPREAAGIFENTELVSLGGATEASIWSIYYPIDIGEKYAVSIPYGIPLSNQEFYILDENLEEKPDWAIGDIYIAGTGLAKGYINEFELTIEKFIYHPGLKRRLYRTGDLGRYRPDGVIEFMGREDSQIKIKGHRIELSEIEGIIQNIDEADNSAVIVYQDKTNEKSIAAFVQPKSMPYGQLENLNTDLISLQVTSYGDRAAKSIDRHLFEKWAEAASRTAILDIFTCFKNQRIFTDQYTGFTLEEIIDTMKIHPYYNQLIRRWLRALCNEGIIQKHSADQKYSLLNSEIPENASQKSWEQWWGIENELGYNHKLVEYFKSSSENLIGLLQGEIDSLDLFFPRGTFDIALAAYHDNIISSSLNQAIIGAVSCFIENTCSQGASNTYRILEVGAGIGGVTRDLIPALDGKNTEYTFTDVSQYFLNEARNHFKAYDFINYGLFDINKDYWSQGIKAGYYDLIICNNVLHNARNIYRVLDHFQDILAEGGALIVADTTGENYSLLTSMEFHAGLSDFDDFRKEGDQVFFNKEQWKSVFEQKDIELACIYPTEGDKLNKSNQAVFVGRFRKKHYKISDNYIKEYLLNKLPEYMIPEHIEILRELPLTENGKVDRKSLAGRMEEVNPFICQQGESAKSELESKIAEIWAAALNRDNIWRDENFYHAGGDSLLIAHVVSKMKENISEVDAWPWELLMKEIVQTPTVAEISRKIENYTPEDSEMKADINPMVVITEGEIKKKVKVLFHDGTGTQTPYDELVLHLVDHVHRKERIIGFEYGNAEEYLSHSSEELIRELGIKYGKQLLEMETQQYELIGYCMGGLIAVEAAKYLIEQGKKVMPVITIDTTPCDPRLKNDLLMERTFGMLIGADLQKGGHDVEDSLLKDALFSLMQDRSKEITVEDLCNCNGRYEKVAVCYGELIKNDFTDRILRLYESTSKQGSNITDYEKERLFTLYEIFRKSFISMGSYGNEPFVGDVIALNCEDKISAFLPVLETRNREFWEEITYGELRMVTVKGNHISCLKEPYAKEIAEMIMYFTTAGGNE